MLDPVVLVILYFAMWILLAGIGYAVERVIKHIKKRKAENAERAGNEAYKKHFNEVIKELGGYNENG